MYVAVHVHGRRDGCCHVIAPPTHFLLPASGSRPVDQFSRLAPYSFSLLFSALYSPTCLFSMMLMQSLLRTKKCVTMLTRPTGELFHGVSSGVAHARMQCCALSCLC